MTHFATTDRFSILMVTLFYISTLIIGYFMLKDFDPRLVENQETKKLVHIVLVEYKKDLTTPLHNSIENAAYALQQIPGVESLRYSTNVSPEGLEQGFTHSLTMKFGSAKDRDSIYLPHPLHRKFVELFVPHTTSILVYDYWE